MKFQPTNSNYHDDRCTCPGCSGLCQDDYEFYSGTGRYASHPTGQREETVPILIDPLEPRMPVSRSLEKTRQGK